MQTPRSLFVPARNNKGSTDCWEQAQNTAFDIIARRYAASQECDQELAHCIAPEFAFVSSLRTTVASHLKRCRAQARPLEVQQASRPMLMRSQSQTESHVLHSLNHMDQSNQRHDHVVADGRGMQQQQGISSSGPVQGNDLFNFVMDTNNTDLWDEMDWQDWNDLVALPSMTQEYPE